MIRRGGVRRLLATTVAQGKFGHGVDVLHLDTDGATPRGMGPGGTQPDQIRAQAVHARCKAAFSDDRQRGIIQRNSTQQLTGVLTTRAQGLLTGAPVRAEPVWIGIKVQTPTNDFAALGR